MTGRIEERMLEDMEREAFDAERYADQELLLPRDDPNELENSLIRARLIRAGLILPRTAKKASS